MTEISDSQKDVTPWWVRDQIQWKNRTLELIWWWRWGQIFQKRGDTNLLFSYKDSLVTQEQCVSQLLCAIVCHKRVVLMIYFSFFHKFHYIQAQSCIKSNLSKQGRDKLLCDTRRVMSSLFWGGSNQNIAQRKDLQTRISHCIHLFILLPHCLNYHKTGDNKQLEARRRTTTRAASVSSIAHRPVWLSLARLAYSAKMPETWRTLGIVCFLWGCH